MRCVIFRSQMLRLRFTPLSMTTGGGAEPPPYESVSIGVYLRLQVRVHWCSFVVANCLFLRALRALRGEEFEESSEHIHNLLCIIILQYICMADRL
jgi:hypothetical protein